MVTIPDRLLELPNVEVIYQDTDLLALRKTLTAPLYDRPSYLRQQAVSFVRAGRQRIADDRGGIRHIAAGGRALLPRGLYTVSDLLPQNGCFRVEVIYFDEQILKGARLGPAARPPEVLPAKRSELIAIVAGLPGVQELFTAPRRRDPLTFLERHFDKPLTLDDYALLTGSSRSTFQRQFRARTGEAPRRWIIRRRMERARQLVDQVDSIDGLATAVGYTNTSHFIRQYRETFGRTPGQDLR